MPRPTGFSFLGVLFLCPSLLLAQPSADSLRHLVDEAWQAIATTYYDTTFNGLDWHHLRSTWAEQDYANREAAYTAIREMLGRLDNPATRFLTPPQARDILVEFSGQAHHGVGLLELLSVDTDEQTRDIVVVTPVPGGPAARAGLRPGDVIVSVDGASAKALGLAEVMTRLRGEAGSAVLLTIRRSEATFDVEIQRAALPPLDAVEGFVQDEAGGKIGYLGLRQFTSEAPEKVRETIEKQEAEGVAGYVLDLRNNPGGLVPAVQQIAGFFLGEETIGYLHARSPDPTPLTAQGKRLTDKPLVLLVNEGSASAAEVLAGAMQYHQHAVVIGEPTFGKGLAHGFSQLSDGSAVMPTTGRLVTPAGRDLLDEGIMPDVLLTMPRSPVIDEIIGVASAEDRQYQRAVALVLEEMPK